MNSRGLDFKHSSSFTACVAGGEKKKKFTGTALGSIVKGFSKSFNFNLDMIVILKKSLVIGVS